MFWMFLKVVVVGVEKFQLDITFWSGFALESIVIVYSLKMFEGPKPCSDIGTRISLLSFLVKVRVIDFPTECPSWNHGAYPWSVWNSTFVCAWLKFSNEKPTPSSTWRKWQKINLSTMVPRSIDCHQLLPPFQPIKRRGIEPSICLRAFDPERECQTTW